MTQSGKQRHVAADSRAIWRAGVAGVAPDRLVAESFMLRGDQLQIVDCPFDVSRLGRITVVGGGKAGSRMVVGLERALEPLAQRIAIDGLVSVPEGTGRETNYVTVCETRPAGRNEPTEAAAVATKAMLEKVSQLRPEDLCIVLLSGGGSALLPAPREGITLADKLAVTRFLSEAGANIEQLNAVRRQLSEIKGGGLARRCAADSLVALIVSDVLGDPLATIASGPTIAADDTAADALAVLEAFDPQRTLPNSVYRVLEANAGQPRRPPDPGKQIHNIIIGNNAVAVDAAGIKAERLGYSHAMQSATESEGEAEAVGCQLARMTLRMLREEGPDCLITGGEPVVKLIDSKQRGRGGRNQQLVLAALIWLRDNANLTAEERSRFALLSGGTDGEDGPTDAAGAILDQQVWARFESLKLDPVDYLRRNDAYSFFERVGGLVKTGPTGTNVCDVRVICVQR